MTFPSPVPLVVIEVASVEASVVEIEAVSVVEIEAASAVVTVAASVVASVEAIEVASEVAVADSEGAIPLETPTRASSCQLKTRV